MTATVIDYVAEARKLTAKEQPQASRETAESFKKQNTAAPTTWQLVWWAKEVVIIHRLDFKLSGLLLTLVGEADRKTLVVCRSLDWLAEATGCLTRSTILKRLASLEAVGAIKKVSGEWSKGKSNTYALNYVGFPRPKVRKPGRPPENMFGEDAE